MDAHRALRASPRSTTTRSRCAATSSRRLDRFTVAADGTAHVSGPPIAQDCTIGVIRLSDGRLAYATENAISVTRP